MDKAEIVVYTPNYRQKIGFFKTWMIMFQNIIKSKELIYQLFRRDFFMSYKKSFLGFSWIILSPIVGVSSWVLLNLTGILTPGRVDIPFLPYVLLGSSLWGLFMGFYSAAQGTLDAGAGFINQVKYPHDALLVKQTAQHLANFLLTFLVNIVVLILFGIAIPWQIILFPIAILPLFFIGGGMGLIMSVVNIVTPDITRIVNVLLGLWFYITPIIYSSTIENEFLRELVRINPLTYLIGGVRDLIIEGKINDINIFFVLSILSFIFFMFAWRLFFVSEDKAIERII